MSDRAKREREACADAGDSSPLGTMLAAMRWARRQAQARPDPAELARI